MAAEKKAAGNHRRGGWTKDVEAISPGDRRAIEILLSALTPLSDLRDRPIPLPFAVVFLSVVLNEGQPAGNYASELKMSRYAMYKYLRSIGNQGRHSTPGLGLVAIKRGYRVKTAVVLTDKGRAVAVQVLEKLRGDRQRPKSAGNLRSRAGPQQGKR
jgi:hypothetical protein